ncbi:MAG: dCTP deaminase [Candidatus Bathyarchaeia archaeon]|nr:dCTP deaminase [Candidatus Bathyarchaeota archaeon]
MILQDSKIKRMVENKELIISPFEIECLNSAGYDLRSSMDLLVYPKEQKLISTLERIELPPNIAGFLHLRSSLIREGLLAGLALVDPGFKGQLTISLFNASHNVIKISQGEPFLQITFIQLQDKAEKPYSGKYQNSKGVTKSLRHIKS